MEDKEKTTWTDEIIAYAKTIGELENLKFRTVSGYSSGVEIRSQAMLYLSADDMNLKYFIAELNQAVEGIVQRRIDELKQRLANLRVGPVQD